MKFSRSKVLGIAATVVTSVVFVFIFIRSQQHSQIAAEFGCPAKDSIFTYNIISGRTNQPNEFRILGIEDFACRIHSSSCGDYKWVAGVSPYFNSNDELQASLARELWPLRVGNHSETKNPWFRIDFDVISYEDVDAPLGTYKAFKITKSVLSRDKHSIVTIWWSPHFHWVIKQKMEMIFGTPPSIGLNNWALETVSLPEVSENNTMSTVRNR